MVTTGTLWFQEVPARARRGARDSWEGKDREECGIRRGNGEDVEEADDNYKSGHQPVCDQELLLWRMKLRGEAKKQLNAEGDRGRDSGGREGGRKGR